MKKRAFTVIELVVVIGIMVILLAIAIPSIRSITRGNNRAQATNMIQAYLANARAKALSQHRKVGVIFFEETRAHIPTANTGQTAMQFIAEDINQSKYATTNTVFVFLDKGRQYLPGAMQVATLNDDPTHLVTTGGGSSNQSRVVIFNAEGQLVLQSGVARPSTTASGSYTPVIDGYYPTAYLDWNLPSHGTTDSGGPSSLGVSSPAILVFNAKDYAAKGFTSSSADQTAAAAWIQANADIIVVNAYTGGIIR